MRILIALLISGLMFACGSSGTKSVNTSTTVETSVDTELEVLEPTTVETSPPWESLPPNDRDFYANVLDCPGVTSLMEAVTSLPLIPEEEWGSANPSSLGNNRWEEARGFTDGMIYVQYRFDADNNRIDEMATLVYGAGLFHLVDYNIVYAIYSGSLTEEQANDNFESTMLLATGKYFCLYM